MAKSWRQSQIILTRIRNATQHVSWRASYLNEYSVKALAGKLTEEMDIIKTSGQAGTPPEKNWKNRYEHNHLQ